jgi:hypothetical protein
VTAATGFLLQGDKQAERIVDTSAEWRCLRAADGTYTPLHYSHGEMRGYFVAGPGERLDGTRFPWGWERPDYDDSHWEAPAVGTPGCPRLSSDAPNPWMLVPRPIPQMEERPERLERVRQVEGAVPPSGVSPVSPAPFTVAPAYQGTSPSSTMDISPRPFPS